MSNAERLDELIEYIAKLHQDTTLYVTQVTFMGVASPEGSYQVNKRLAKGRMTALENYIRSRIQIPENIVIRDSETYIPWNYLIAEIDNSDFPRGIILDYYLHKELRFLYFFQFSVKISIFHF